MKTLMKILLAIAGVAVIAVAAVFYFTAGMVDVADEFFTAAREGDMDKAYAHVSADFQAGTSRVELAEFLEQHGLALYEKSSWHSRSREGGLGELVGSITTESGGAIPVTLRFVRAGGAWKIHSIEKPPAGIRESAAALEVPAKSELAALAGESMHVFAVSVNEGSMARFHRHISDLWQAQFTVEDLDDAFGVFYDLGVDLTVLDGLSPRFDSRPEIDSDGMLTLSGVYPSEPSRVHFEQKYIVEGPGWKLVGLSVNIE